MTSEDVQDLVGVPFRYGGRSREEGLGCWGLALEVLRRMGRSFQDPVVAVAQADDPEAAMRGVESSWRDAAPPLREGDLLVLRQPLGPVPHVAVYLSDGRVIHSVLKAGVVTEPYSRIADKVLRVLRPPP